MNEKNRPLSPHLTIYRPQFTSVLSIAHRITGVVNFIGLIFFTLWIISASMGEDSFSCIQNFLNSYLGKVFLLGWTLALFYHLLNGIRHLVWDFGFGFELKNAFITGLVVVVTSFILTCFIWICI